MQLKYWYRFKLQFDLTFWSWKCCKNVKLPQELSHAALKAHRWLIRFWLWTFMQKIERWEFYRNLFRASEPPVWCISLCGCFDKPCFFLRYLTQSIAVWVCTLMKCFSIALLPPIGQRRPIFTSSCTILFWHFFFLQNLCRWLFCLRWTENIKLYDGNRC